jgi:hypothetical protein
MGQWQRIAPILPTWENPWLPPLPKPRHFRGWRPQVASFAVALAGLPGYHWEMPHQNGGLDRKFIYEGTIFHSYVR